MCCALEKNFNQNLELHSRNESHRHQNICHQLANQFVQPKLHKWKAKQKKNNLPHWLWLSTSVLLRNGHPCHSMMMQALKLLKPNPFHHPQQLSYNLWRGSLIFHNSSQKVIFNKRYVLENNSWSLYLTEPMVEDSNNLRLESLLARGVLYSSWFWWKNYRFCFLPNTHTAVYSQRGQVKWHYLKIDIGNTLLKVHTDSYSVSYKRLVTRWPFNFMGYNKLT